MKQFSLLLDENMQRPVICLEDWYHLNAMIDTGSLFPIWIASERTLEGVGGKKIQENVSFGGFGGEAKGNLYRLPLLKIGELVYPEMPIIACEIELPCDLILSASMFSHLNYEIDDENHRFNVTIPEAQSNIRSLKIWDEKGHLRVLCTSAV